VLVRLLGGIHLSAGQVNGVRMNEQTTFERNMIALQAFNADLVTRLRECPGVPDMRFEATKQEVPTASYLGRQLSSRHRPLEEAERLTSSVDLAEHAVVVVLGFGLGYHVQRLAERMKRTGLVVVFEPDLSLLRTVFETIDHSAWIKEAQLVVFTSADDRTELLQRLDGAQGIVTQGTTFVTHPASRDRLGEQVTLFSDALTELVGSMRTTMVTTLVHSSTTCRNLALNLDHYSCGDGLDALSGWASGHAAILIAAGPSLTRNLHLLEDPDIRNRAVIIAVQTMLKPLLARGIRPHFVTALDYHEISKQFYDGLTAEDVRGVTLVCEPKANRAILESFPGAVRCVGNAFLDQLLGSVARPMDQLTAGATVAHLNFYLAQYLGCDPIAFIGQDLGFTDGLYYGTGAAIHEQWGPEINRFNTVEMMEWKRIVRMKRTLHERDGHGGRSVLLDEQMETYLQQFERDFASAPQRVIDATEGGAIKAHTDMVPLRDVLERVRASSVLPECPEATFELSENRRTKTRRQLREQRGRANRLAELSRTTSELIEQMIADQQDAVRMDQHFKKLDRYRAESGRLSDTMKLANSLNQLGTFNRLKADRRLELSEDLDPVTRQRRQLERDKTNLDWLADAADELVAIIDESDRILRGESVNTRINQRLAEIELPDELESADESGELDETGLAIDTNVVSEDQVSSVDVVEVDAEPIGGRVAAMIAVDPDRNGLLLDRRLSESFLGRSVLQCTLERVDRCRGIESIILLTPSDSVSEIEALIDRSRLDHPVIVESAADDSVYEEAHRSVAAARRWSDTSWRGGVGGDDCF